MLFTFLSITYNHEKFIAQHLESIKYQIVNYGDGLKFQLIVSDDCSSDDTMNIIHSWLKENSGLFNYVDILESDTNQGACNNYTKGIRKIKGDYFKRVEGDDIFAKDNVFEAVKLLKTFDIIVTPTGPFTCGKLFADKKILSRIYLMYKFCNTDYRYIQRYNVSIPMNPGVFMRKELITEDVLSFINQFTHIGDRSRNIKIYEQNKMLKIGCCEKILVLYRHHENAVTKTTNKNIIKLFKEDDTKMDEYVTNKTKNFFIKCRFNYNILRRKVDNKRLANLLNIEQILYRISFLLNYCKYRKRIKNIKNLSYMPNNEHLRTIIEEAKKYNANSI